MQRVDRLPVQCGAIARLLCAPARTLVQIRETTWLHQLTALIRYAVADGGNSTIVDLIDLETRMARQTLTADDLTHWMATMLTPAVAAPIGQRPR